MTAKFKVGEKAVLIAKARIWAAYNGSLCTILSEEGPGYVQKLSTIIKCPDAKPTARLLIGYRIRLHDGITARVAAYMLQKTDQFKRGSWDQIVDVVGSERIKGPRLPRPPADAVRV